MINKLRACRKLGFHSPVVWTRHRDRPYCRACALLLGFTRTGESKEDSDGHAGLL